ncbi:MAG: hypothetical protein OEW15_10545 [Nitrospirota bacterium]|nr:hypothetical protein [Nitrospirota bacterium]
MKRIAFAVAVLFVATVLPGVARADLDRFIKNLNVEAQADIGNYNVKVSQQFGVSEVQVKEISSKVDSPADAFLCLQVAQMTERKPEEVLRVYQQNRGKGWGAIAKAMGIKPGSPEFHALKSGNFELTGRPGGGAGQGQGKGKGKGRGRN